MSSEQPPGVFPLIFESGVVNVDEDGVLHVHLTHGPDAPHPMVTHPDGEETVIPGRATEAHIEGGPGTNTRLRCSLREIDTLPEGFVFHIKGWRLLQLEMSGDLTVVVEGVHSPPDWFQHGKIHRFDGPDDEVRIYTGSQPLVDPRISAAPRRPTARPPTPTAPRPAPTPPAADAPKAEASGASKRGCGGLLLLMLLVAASAGVWPALA